MLQRSAVMPLAGILGLLAVSQPAEAQLRVVSWNTLDGPGSSSETAFRTVFDAIGDESVNGVSIRPAIVALQEQTGASPANVAGMLNSLNGVSSYRSAVNPDSQDMLGFAYDSSLVELLGVQEVGVGFRPAFRATFRLVGYTSPDAVFHVYSVHLKAGQSDDQTRRAEAARLRLDGNNLGAGAHIIYAGDFNVYGAYEDAYQNMLTLPGEGRAVDPLNGSWGRGSHTQSTRSGSIGDGGAGGGMDDRFDFQFISEEMGDGEGLSLIGGSYRAFGNNGSHAFNGSITSGNGAPAHVLNALVQASDHLPVVADYQLPAKMTVRVDPAPRRVIVGADAAVTVRVENTAPVVSAIGADELDYTVSGGGAVTGSASGSDAALGGGNTHTLTLDTSIAGGRRGSVGVESTSQGVEGGSFSQEFSVDVLDHANASFAGDGDVDTLTLDFGGVAQDAATPVLSFEIFNLLSSVGFTAGLDLDRVRGAGDTDRLALDGAWFVNLMGGGSAEFNVTLDTTEVGAFAARYWFDVSDEDLLGAVSGPTLRLDVLGEVVAVPEPSALALLGGLSLLLTRRRGGGLT